MRIGIIGAGFGGLSAGYYLAKNGEEVTVFESGDKPGGLAIGFKKPNWNWTIESHYHHWFTNDASVLELAKEINYNVNIVRPKTSTFIDGNIYQLDSPLSLLMFKKLTLKDRIRTGIVLAYLKFTNDWKPLEKITAQKFIIEKMGLSSWETLWEPLFSKKFSKYASKIPAAWFWSRIKKRTPSLAYPEKGFLPFAESVADSLQKYNGKIYYKTIVEKIVKKGEKIYVKTAKSSYEFDKVIVTLPTPLFIKITEGLPQNYLNSLVNLQGIGAANLLLSLNKQFLTDGSYWLNINEKNYPFLAVVEHTNFMDKKNYNNEHLIYVGNYLPHDHAYFHKDANSLLKEFTPYLQRINPSFNTTWVNDAFLFKAFFAQPIIPLNYSETIPEFKTPIKGLYLCNIQQVYPWDRGTNYAVENGRKVAEMIINSEKI